MNTHTHLQNKKERQLQKFIDQTAEITNVDERMNKINSLMDGHGVEAITWEGEHVSKYWMNIIALYVNMGDTYDMTVLYETETEEFTISSWGDFVERRDIL